MKRFLSLLAISLISTNVGCSLCSSCDDYSYGAFGGLWERSDLTYGRVGSAFGPEGLSVSADNAADVDDPGATAPENEAVAPPAPDEAPLFEADEPSLLET